MSHRTATILLAFIVAGVVLGIASGWYFGPAMVQVEWIGKLFLDALKMLIVPLVVAALISGIAALGDIRHLGRIGSLTMGYFMVTTAIAVLIGLFMANLIQPGAGLDYAPSDGEVSSLVAGRGEIGFTDILLSLVSPNLIASAAEMELIPLIVFSIFFGAALTTLGDAGRPVIAFFSGVNDAMMKLVIWLMFLAPIGIFALVASRLGKAGGGDAFAAQLAAVGWHVLTVLGGLFAHLLVLIAILVFVAGRGLDYMLNLMRALLTAFGTASSSATIPLTIECVRESNVDERVARFTIPIGATVNMNGTALYEAAAALFIAQAYGIDLGLQEQVIVFLTATLAAIAAAGIPEAGLVTMVIVLNAVGLPLEGIGLLLAVDWFLDRFRTAINVWSDAVGAAVVDRWLRGGVGSRA
ncbi:MAG: dicarboxylate/amino acid:cation symporter [Gammaproteobacteria bacterium]|jgi:Na+/H+-dicarboxylate symporter|nr:dicarboxylate/amino acid:cation symporter [Gammaproteobacteria bacterium]